MSWPVYMQRVQEGLDGRSGLFRRQCSGLSTSNILTLRLARPIMEVWIAHVSRVWLSRTVSWKGRPLVTKANTSRSRNIDCVSKRCRCFAGREDIQTALMTMWAGQEPEVANSFVPQHGQFWILFFVPAQYLLCFALLLRGWQDYRSSHYTRVRPICF